MYIAKGGNLNTVDFRDYSLIAAAYNTKNLFFKDTKLTDIKKGGLDIDTSTREWASYATDSGAFAMNICRDKDGPGGDIVDRISGQSKYEKKLGAIPKDCKKAVIGAVENKDDKGAPVRVFVKVSKLTKAIMLTGEGNIVNFCVNSIITNKLNKPDRYDKLAEKVNVKDKSPRIIYNFNVDVVRTGKIVAYTTKRGPVAGIFVCDKITKDNFVVSFGGPEIENINHSDGVKKLFHFKTNIGDPDTIVKFVANLKKFLFAAGKGASVDKKATGDEKTHNEFGTMLKIVKSMYENKTFINLAVEATK